MKAFITGNVGSLVHGDLLVVITDDRGILRLQSIYQEGTVIQVDRTSTLTWTVKDLDRRQAHLGLRVWYMETCDHDWLLTVQAEGVFAQGSSF